MYKVSSHLWMLVWLLSAGGVSSVWSVVCVHSVWHNEGRTCMFERFMHLHFWTVFEMKPYLLNLSAASERLSVPLLSVLIKWTWSSNRLKTCYVFSSSFPWTPWGETHSANKAAKRVETKALVSRKPTSAPHYQTITKSFMKHTSRPSCSFMSSFKKYRHVSQLEFLPANSLSCRKAFYCVVGGDPTSIIGFLLEGRKCFSDLALRRLCWCQASLPGCAEILLQSSIPGDAQIQDCSSDAGVQRSGSSRSRAHVLCNVPLKELYVPGLILSLDLKAAMKRKLW